MKVFMVHSFKDFTEDVSKQEESKLPYQLFKEILYFFNPKVKLFNLRKKSKIKGVLWKKEAKKKIKESNIVLYIDSSSESENTKWELNCAFNLEKTIMTLNYNTLKLLFPFYLHIKNYIETHDQLTRNTEIRQEDIREIFGSKYQLNEESLNKFLKDEDNTIKVKDFLINIHRFIEFDNEPIAGFQVFDDYSGDQRRIDVEVNISQLQEEAIVRLGMQGLQINENKEFEQFIETEKMQLLLEQYKIFVQSSETLMQRRQSINSFYITANTVLVALFAAVVALKDVSQLLIIVSGLGLSGIGIVITRAWKTILLSYGKLNSSKIKVISAIEKRLPVSLYDLEWSVMSNDTSNGGYKPFTKSEATTAATFFWLYLIAFIATALLLVFFIFLKD